MLGEHDRSGGARVITNEDHGKVIKDGGSRDVQREGHRRVSHVDVVVVTGQHEGHGDGRMDGGVHQGAADHGVVSGGHPTDGGLEHAVVRVGVSPKGGLTQ